MKQKIEGGWNKQRAKLLNDFFVEVEPNNKAGEFIVDGQWYAPKFGCDTLDMVVDEVEYLVASERQRCVEGCINALPNPITYNYSYTKFFEYSDDKKEGFNEAIDQAKHNLEQLK